MSAKTPRQRWMAILARASLAEMSALLRDCPELPACTVLRGPQSGLVMLRGRAGGGGAAFNLGEMTVTRCTVRAQGGEVGHAYIAGREMGRAETGRAELAARIDAALQDISRHAAIEAAVIAPLERAQAERRQEDAERAAATRVQFFTMATMRS